MGKPEKQISILRAKENITWLGVVANDLNVLAQSLAVPVLG